MVSGTHMKIMNHVVQPASSVSKYIPTEEVHDLNSDPKNRVYAAS